MGTGYIRNDTGDNIADGNVINASDLDGEFDALQSAFDNSTGHTHDGTAAEGAPIEKVGPNQEVVVTATVLRPAANNTIDLGVETTNEFKNLYIDGTAYLDSVDIDGGTIDGLSVLTVDNLSLNGNTITSTDTNGNLNLRANGTGIISVDATDVNFGDSDKATFGDDSDLSITHNGTNSIITDSGTGNLLLRGSNVSIQNAAGDETVAQFVEDSFVKLYHDNSEVFSTTSTGISVTGDVDASDDLILSSDGSKITFGADGDVEITHSHNVGLIFDNTNTSDDQDFVLTLRSNEDTILADEQIARINFSTNSSAGGQAAGTQASIKVDATDTYSATVAGSRMEFHTTTGSGTNTRAMYIDDDQSVVFTGPSANVTLDATNSTLDFPDNFKIMMGAGDDLSIYHDGSNSFISDQGTGNLKILADDFRIRNAADTDSYIFVNSGAEVGLTYNGSTKLETTSTGVDITGGFTATDGSTITVNDNSVALNLVSTDTDASQGPILRLYRNAVGAASDVIGTLHYYGQDVAGNDTQYAEIEGRIEDATNGAEDGTLVLSTMVAGTSRSRLNFYSTEAVFNDGSQDIDFRVESNGSENMLFVDGGNNRIGVGTNVPTGLLDLRAATGSGTLNIISTINAVDAGNKIAFFAADRADTDEEMAYIKPLLVTNSGGSGNVQEGHLTFGTSGNEAMRIDSSGNVGISSSSPTSLGTGMPTLELKGNSASQTDRAGGIRFERYDGTYAGAIFNADGAFKHDSGAYPMLFVTNSAERMRIDTSGNLLVGKTSDDAGAAIGVINRANGRVYATVSGGEPAILNRLASDGDIIDFKKDGTSVGSIGVETIGGTGYPFICNTKSGNAGLHFAGRIQPTDHTGDRSDNTVDLGFSSFRFDDIYATNGTIQTSDRNEKQDIAELSDAEQRVAVAAKGLMRKFRWRDAVEAKGDEARTHFGIIAQDLQAAFAAEGLDAGDYAMFISSTWTDEETGEERTRMGVRYSELLAFIIAAI